MKMIDYLLGVGHSLKEIFNNFGTSTKECWTGDKTATLNYFAYCCDRGNRRHVWKQKHQR